MDGINTSANALNQLHDDHGHGGDRVRTAVALPAPKNSMRSRKLHLGHFAFMRAVVQGLDSRANWERYLRVEGDHDDIRNVNKTIAWIRDEFAAAAKRHDRFGTARLVKLDAGQIADNTPVVPTLEQFATDHDLVDFSEREQLEQYQAQYGSATHQQSRRRRLIARQLDALAWLERLVAQPPQGGDAIASWLHPDLVVHLEAAGLFTVHHLVDRINGMGKRWWTGIRAIGTAKAARIIDWVATHEATTGLPIGAHVNIKRSKLYAHELDRVVPRATAIVPMEKFIMPTALNGADGLYRAPQRLCLMRATNDYEAILTWIKSKQGLPEAEKAAMQRTRGIDPAAPAGPMAWLQTLSHTQRAYRKEAERFMLWAIVQHGKPLSSMTLEDCEAYRAFLANPTPADRWCGPRGRAKWGPLWRPFEGPLSPRAQRHAITILKSLYKFLVDQCYLIGNPWNGISLPKGTEARINKGRSFTQSQWRFIEQQLGSLADTSANRRLRFALHLFYATGLRLAEGIAARVDDLNWVTYPSDGEDEDVVEGWELTVIGKGLKMRTVPVPLDVIGELSQYLVSRGLDPDPEHALNRGAFLFGKAVDVAARAPWSPLAMHRPEPKEGISAGTLYEQLKGYFADCATALAATDAKGAQRLAAASTHWLRHTHGSHSVAAGTPLDVLQQNLGHASLNTTTIYVTSEDRRRMKAVQRFWNKAGLG